MDIFPAFYPLAGKRVIIAGEGEPADSKARLFAGSPAEVVRLIGDAALDPAAYAGAALIFIATWDEAFAVAATEAARTAGVPVNVVDRPAMSDFHTPAIVDRGAVVAAIGTGGGAPVLASLLRAEIEARFSPNIGAVASLLAERRDAIRRAFPDLSKRRAFFRAALGGLVALQMEGDQEELARLHLDVMLNDALPPYGSVVWIVEPPADDLLSLRAARALSIADTVIAAVETPLITRHARRDAERRTPFEGMDNWMLGQVFDGKLIAVVAATQEPAVLALLGGLAEVLLPAPGQ